MKNYFFGIQNHERTKMDFVHMRFSVAGGLRPLNTPAEFGTFFFISQKNICLVQKTYFLTKNVDLMS